MLKTTPFHARTAPLCMSHAWRRWSGHIVASSYELSHEREYHAVRSAAALFDISPLYKYAVCGKDAARLLDRVMTRDIARSEAGQVLFGCPYARFEVSAIGEAAVALLLNEFGRVWGNITQKHSEGSEMGGRFMENEFYRIGELRVRKYYWGDDDAFRIRPNLVLASRPDVERRV